MDYEKIVQKRNRYQAVRDSIPELTLQSYEKAFEIEYTHNSTAIEGNTLTLIETKVLLEDGISIGGKHLRELYEAVNHQKAYRYVKECIAKELPLNERIIKDIHAILMENISSIQLLRKKRHQVWSSLLREISTQSIWLNLGPRNFQKK